MVFLRTRWRISTLSHSLSDLYNTMVTIKANLVTKTDNHEND